MKNANTHVNADAETFLCMCERLNDQNVIT